jgi:hypothetical protein
MTNTVVMKEVILLGFYILLRQVLYIPQVSMAIIVVQTDGFLPSEKYAKVTTRRCFRLAAVDN